MCVLNGRIHKMKLAKKGDVMFKVRVMLVLLVLVSSCVLSPPVGKLTGTTGEINELLD
jgi:hypothetical protein